MTETLLNVSTQPQNTSQLHIIIENLNLWYGEKQALKNISMQIIKNNVTALIDPSDCVKSTFLRHLNRMNDLIKNCKVAGKILIKSKDIYRKGVDVVDLRKKIGMVFQKPNPFPMSIYDNIAYGPRIHGVTKKDINSLVESSLQSAALWEETSSRLKSPVFSLNGGQQ